MSIKSDKWIRRMAESHRMIDPFEPNQVKRNDSGPIVSYGTSSYGYDIRCSDEFKIFTNINSTIVDPKNFDAKSFVDFKGDVCIIPPNSFALARTVEYFRIPRNVLSICLGKSTYARCFRGDQRVALVDGTSVAFEDMARRADQGEDFWGYSLGEFGRIHVTKLEAPRLVGRDALIEIALDSGEPIRCTSDHVFIRRDGTTAPAGDLRPGDSLMPLYRELFRGYEMVYQPINRHYTPTHRLADEWNLHHGVYTDRGGERRHHLDHDRRNNRPWNITRMAAAEHIRHHDRENFGAEFDPAEHGAAIREGFRRLTRDPAWRERFAAAQQARAQAFWRDPGYADVRSAVIAGRSNPCRNHKIEKIRDLPGDHDVYCLTVPEAGNFALESGVFVSNCGIIVNVTPFEPEWEGFVTLEFSNTTPLPAKIYANEGVAQVLFFEADEVCETSYKDRGGKYQSQQGVTLPKT
jgi:deoxycytidine triphosphate deaminase